MPVIAAVAAMTSTHPGNLYRASARQSNDAFEPGRIILKRQFATVQPRHRGGEAQAQAGARLRPALLEPHEALEHPFAVGLGNAGPVVGHGQQDAVAVA